MKNVMTITLAVTIAVGAMLAAATLTSCKDDKSKRLDPNARIYISSAQMPQSAPSHVPALAEGAEQVKLTPLEMLLATTSLRSTKANIGILGINKDTANVRFIVPSIWAIDQHGKLEIQFIESRDYLFIDRGEDGSKFDTIGYIRNELMIKAEREVKAAYAAENYTECYRLLQEAFEFIPTTGAEYRELQASGNN